MFGLRDKVQIKNGGPEIWAVEQIMDLGIGKKYLIELGRDSATRQWKEESEIELFEKAINPDSSPGFVPGRGIMD